MTVKELKRSLVKFGSDFDDTEILMQYATPDGKTDVDLLAFTGNTKDCEAVILGTKLAYLSMKKKGILPEKEK